MEENNMNMKENGQQVKGIIMTTDNEKAKLSIELENAKSENEQLLQEMQQLQGALAVRLRDQSGSHIPVLNHASGSSAQKMNNTSKATGSTQNKKAYSFLSRAPIRFEHYKPAKYMVDLLEAELTVEA